MRPLAFLAAVFGTVTVSALSVVSAQADAIDGTWCAADGRIMEIHGPQISTPGGNDISGAYDRHAFSYVVPADESRAGETVRMVLMNHNIIHLKIGDVTGEPEVWQRCETVS